MQRGTSAVTLELIVNTHDAGKKVRSLMKIGAKQKEMKEDVRRANSIDHGTGHSRQCGAVCIRLEIIP